MHFFKSITQHNRSSSQNVSQFEIITREGKARGHLEIWRSWWMDDGQTVYQIRRKKKEIEQRGKYTDSSFTTLTQQTGWGTNQQSTNNKQQQQLNWGTQQQLNRLSTPQQDWTLIILWNSRKMERLLGPNLLVAPGASTPTRDALRGKELILLYFSASW